MLEVSWTVAIRAVAIAIRSEAWSLQTAQSLKGILVDTIIRIGKKLDLTLVAEGIETEEQRQALLQRGVRFGQGWLYSRALPLDEFEQFMQVSNPS